MKNRNNLALLLSVLTVVSCSGGNNSDEDECGDTALCAGPGVVTHTEKISSLLDSVGSLTNTERMGWLLAFDFTEGDQVSFFSTFFEIDSQNPQNNPVAELLSVQGDT